MKDLGKRNVLGVMVDAVDYDSAVQRIVDAAKGDKGYAVTALAVHGVMEGVADEGHRYRLNQFDLITPDGQPVRWALNFLHRTTLTDRVYGPKMTGLVCAAAEREGLPVYFYGSKQVVLDELIRKMGERFPKLKIAGAEPSKFRKTDAKEKLEIAARIRASGAKITFVGLGCPRQEVWAYEYRDLLSMPVLAVGAAFDYHAGLTTEPPAWMQALGLQWFYRLCQEPTRLWKRYIILNPKYLTLLAGQALGVWRPDPDATHRPEVELNYG